MIWGGAPAQAAIAAAPPAVAGGASPNVTVNVALRAEALGVVAYGDSLATVEIVARPVADPGLRAESVGAARGDQPAAAEAIGRQRADPGLFAETLHRPQVDSPIAAAIMGTMLSDEGLPSEWSKLIAVTADVLMRLEMMAIARVRPLLPAESAGAAATTVTSDGGAPIEWRALVRAGNPVPDEMLGKVLADIPALLELLITTRREHALSVEMLDQARLETGLPSELLSSGTVILADSPANFESEGTPPATPISVETGPDRVRLLATPGRIRLLRRN